MDSKVTRVLITVIPAEPGWEMVGWFRDERTNTVQLWKERIIGWRVVTEEMEDHYVNKQGRPRINRGLRDLTEPITAEGGLDYHHEQFAAVREPSGRLFSPGFKAWDNEQALIESLDKENK